jgi:hypothetical protein
MRNLFLNSVGWLPGVDGVVVLGTPGGVLGLTGVFGHPTTTQGPLTVLIREFVEP